MTDIFCFLSGRANAYMPGMPDNVVAIYETDDPDDATPAALPLVHLNRIRFHNHLQYLKIVGHYASSDPGRGSIVLPQTNAQTNAFYTQAGALFDHGLPYTPLVEGRLVINGVTWPLSGTVMPNEHLQITLFVTPTQVALFVLYSLGPQLSIDWEVDVYAEPFQAATGAPDNIGLDLTEDAAHVARLGKIDQHHNFLFEDPNGETWINGSRTIELVGGEVSAGIHYSNGKQHYAASSSITLLGQDQPDPPPAHFATYKQVTRHPGSPLGTGFEHGRMTIEGADGLPVFNSDYPMLTCLDKQGMQGTLVLGERGWNPNGAHVTRIDHDVGGLPVGTQLLYGWMKITSADGQNNLPPVGIMMAANGSVVVNVDAVTSFVNGPLNPDYLIVLMRVLTPEIGPGNRLMLSEQYFNRRYTGGAGYARDIPETTIDYHIYPVAFQGGN